MASTGIPRSRGVSPRIQLDTTESPVAIRRNQEQIVAAITNIQDRLNLVDDRLSKRINEMLMSGDLAERPPAGVQDRIFFAIDTGAAFYDDGTNWRAI